MEQTEVVLQVWQAASGQWGGRILRDGEEDGRVAGCNSQDNVEATAMESGIDYDRVELLDHVPPVL